MLDRLNAAVDWDDLACLPGAVRALPGYGNPGAGESADRRGGDAQAPGSSPNTARVDTSYVWGQRYIDELVSRDRDTNTGTAGLEERLFALHDTMFSVTAMVNTSGGVQERYDYNAYGQRLIFDNSWATRATS
jgi:hypothetical protein